MILYNRPIVPDFIRKFIIKENRTYGESNIVTKNKNGWINSPNIQKLIDDIDDKK